MDKSDETWKAGTVIPEVKKGCEYELVVAVRRAKSGKVYSFSASYLNAYPLNYNDGCPKGDGCSGEGCDDGCPTTGWFYQTGEDGDSSQYNSLQIANGDELVGWRHIPQWPGAVQQTAKTETK